MISHILVIIVLTNCVLSEPDLCRNPKLDSITYIPKHDMWFMTSGGYYWYLSDKNFPPNQHNFKGPLKEPFKRGDASVFMDQLTVCGKGDQTVIIVEKIGDSNQILLYNTLTNNFMSETRTWSADRNIGRAKISQTQAIEAMFPLRETEIYIVEGQKYAAIDWRQTCDKPDEWAKSYDPNSNDDFQNVNERFDSLAIKKDVMYQFVGKHYWTVDIDVSQSMNGKIVTGSKSAALNLTDFFKFPKGQPCPAATPSGDHSNDGTGSGNGGAVDRPTDNASHSEVQMTNSIGGGMFFLVVVIVVIVVLVLVVGVVYLVMRKESDVSATPNAKPVPAKTPKKAAPSPGPPKGKLNKK